MAKNDFERGSEMKAQRMEINLENILPSLAKNLYGDDWRISIRELLQNAHDTLVEARIADKLPGGMGQIEVIPDSAHGTLTFRDNGLGMTRDEVGKYMATVGAGRKREQLETMIHNNEGSRDLLDQVIGQYGIGFLSSFIIADKVRVLSRSRLDEKTLGVNALFTGETEWYSEDVTSEMEFGTEIVLKLKTNLITDPITGESCSIVELLNFERLVSEVRRFGALLPFNILVYRDESDMSPELCGEQKAPWENDIFEMDRCLEFLRMRRPDENSPISPIPFAYNEKEHGVSAHGLIYFPSPGREMRKSNISVAHVELFCRRMYITDSIEALLPDWAGFVGVLVECPNLTPTLNRNDVIRHGPAFSALKVALGTTVVSNIQKIAKDEPQLFADIRERHIERLYAGLLSDFQDSPNGQENFFRGVIDCIAFQVINRSNPSGSPMTLRQYRKEAANRMKVVGKNEDPSGLVPIYYLERSGAAGQLRAMIVQKDIPVVSIVRQIELALLNAYQNVYQNAIALEPITSILDLYVSQVDQVPYESIKQYLASLDGGGPDEVRASRFTPDYIPAIMIAESAGSDGQAGILEGFLKETGGALNSRTRERIRREAEESRSGSVRRTVLLNDNNILMRQIKNHCAIGGGLTGETGDVLHEIYHLSRIYIEPEMAETEHYFQHRNQLLLKLVEKEKRQSDQEDEVDQLKLNLKSVQKEREQLEVNIALYKERSDPKRPMMKMERCLLLTDLIKSTIVSFLDSEDAASIIRRYADGVCEIIKEKNGRIEQFTGDGIFASFDATGEKAARAARDAASAATRIRVFTREFFEMKDVQAVLLKQGGLNLGGSRTVLHFGEVVEGYIADSVSLTGRQVVLLFRASQKKELFEDSPVVVTEPIKRLLNLNQELRSVASDIKLDPNLPHVSIYAYNV